MNSASNPALPYATPQPGLARSRWTIVLLMVAMSLMSYFDRTIVGVAAPRIMAEFELSEGDMGGIFSAFQLSYALCMIPGGFLADRYGPRLMLSVMGFGAALFTGLTACAGRPGLGIWLGVLPSFILIRALFGVFTAPLYPSCARANAVWIPAAARSRVQGFIAAGAGLGGAVSPVLFPWLIGALGWRGAFAAAGLATGLLTLAWCTSIRDRPVAPRPAIARVSWRGLLASRDLRWLTASYFAVGYFEYVFFNWTFYYLKEVHGFGERESGWASALINLSWMVMSPLGGWASDRLVERRGPRAGLRIVPLASLSLAVLFLLLANQMAEPAAIVTCIALAFGCAGASDAPFWAAAIRLGGKDAGAASAIMNTGCNLGGVSPWITGRIAQRWGWSSAFHAMTLVLALGLVAWLWIDPSRTVIKEGEETN